MGQQLRKIVKRRRLKAYRARKKALAKSGGVRKVSRAKTTDGETVKKSPAKKAAKKTTKAPAAKKTAKPAADVTAKPEETAAE